MRKDLWGKGTAVNENILDLVGASWGSKQISTSNPQHEEANMRNDVSK